MDAASWVNKRGFGRFTRNAVGCLIESDRRTSYVFYGDERSVAGDDLPPGAERRAVRLSRPPGEAAAAGSSRSVADVLRLTRAVRRDRLDAFLFPSTHTWFPVFGTPTVVGVHDTIVEDLPELTMGSSRERLASSVKHRLAVRHSTCLFTVSEASRAAIAVRWGIPASRLRIVPEAPDPVFSPRTGAAIGAGLAAAGLEPGDRFFLYAGGISPHKNVETLIEAYARVRADAVDAVPLLVLVGELEGEKYLSSAEAVLARIARHDLGEVVRLPGFVTDETLACLYAGATAVVLPSLAEGFGLPAVEAAACGAPVALSDVPAHRETLGEAALFFPPRDVAALANVLRRLAGDDELRIELGARARAAVSDLSWDAAAAELRSLIRAAVEA